MLILFSSNFYWSSSGIFGSCFSITLRKGIYIGVGYLKKKKKKRKKGGEETSEKSEELEGKGQGNIREGDYPLL